MPECRCDLDGSGGPGCNLRSEMFCLNQCSGRGHCNLGFCVCDPGWWGLDCAHAASAEAARAPPPALAPWLRELAVDAWRCGSSGGGCLEELTAAADHSVRGSMDGGGGGGGAPAVGDTKAGPAAAGRMGGPDASSEAAAGDDDDAFSSAGADYGSAVGAMPLPDARPPLPQLPSLQQVEATSQPQHVQGAGATTHAGPATQEDPFGGMVDDWAASSPGGRRRRQLRASRLRQLLQLRQQTPPAPELSGPHADAAAASGGGGGAPPKGGGAGPHGRLRPLVYVYDVPSTYAGRMLQYRMYKESCAWRWFDAEYGNATLTSPYPYGGGRAPPLVRPKSFSGLAL